MAKKKQASQRRKNPMKSSAPLSAASQTRSQFEGQFDKRNLETSPISLPLLAEMDRLKDEGNEEAVIDIIIDINLEYPKGRQAARHEIWEKINNLIGVTETKKDTKFEGNQAKKNPSFQGILPGKSKYSQQYLFGRLNSENIRKLVSECRASTGASRSPLYRVWLDHPVQPFINKSTSTVKADAARNAFGTLGKDIVWAVADTGIDSKHPHFTLHKNLLDLGDPLMHRDFTQDGDDRSLMTSACKDVMGHGTHVAGIIAGYFSTNGSSGVNGRKPKTKHKIEAVVYRRDEQGSTISDNLTDIEVMSGMAPECKILSLKVLDDEGRGNASNLIAALEYIQELNGHGRRIRVHGVNLSVGYDFEPKWFACGQSPLCIEVNRLVRSGVVVVVAAGNTGYGHVQFMAKGSTPAGLDLTINDPGNAELAITVGSTHRDMPHVYGVSYFSSKGPTGDGRIKPDLVAPGEKIISCQSRQFRGATHAKSPQSSTVARYMEDSGTSMAAPHVSGVIAAFLSVRREFIGQPEAVKQIFLSTATDLKRAIYFQGKGLVDLMRAVQSV